MRGLKKVFQAILLLPSLALFSNAQAETYTFQFDGLMHNPTRLNLRFLPVHFEGKFTATPRGPYVDLSPLEFTATASIPGTNDVIELKSTGRFHENGFVNGWYDALFSETKLVSEKYGLNETQIMVLEIVCKGASDGPLAMRDCFLSQNSGLNDPAWAAHGGFARHYVTGENFELKAIR
jgi:hypothetical protein